MLFHYIIFFHIGSESHGDAKATSTTIKTLTKKKRSKKIHHKCHNKWQLELAAAKKI